jgi:glycolate oxidase
MLFKRIDGADIAAFEAIMPGRVLVGDAIREDYDHDEMTEYGHYMPEAVLQALSTREISALMMYCNQNHIAVTPRGAGTGLCGGCVAKEGGIVLSTEKMNRVLVVDVHNMAATVEPGVLLMDFPKALKDTGLFYPPDPGEKTATMGGNAMTNAGGMRAVRYGVTRDYVLAMEVVLANGEILNLGGKVVKNASGYSLIDLMVGSEGTLGILTKLTVKLIPEPKANLSILVPFDALDKCIEAVPAVLACGCEPTAVEFMEREVIGAAEQYLGKQFPDVSADAYLLVRLDGPSRGELEPALDTLTGLLLSLGAKDVLLADTDERKESIWNARGAFLEAIKGGTPGMDECDVVVPRDRIAEFVRKSIAIGKELDIRICSFGHAGDGNLHLYACQDNLTDDLWEGKRARVMDSLYEQAHLLGGHVSGEHGIGHAKVGFLRDALGDTQIALMRGIKRVFDPNNILNPGKVISMEAPSCQ